MHDHRLDIPNSANGLYPVPRKTKAARQRKRDPSLSLTFWFQAGIHRTSESLVWVAAPGDHLVYGEQGLDGAIQAPVKSSHEYFWQRRV